MINTHRENILWETHITWDGLQWWEVLATLTGDLSSILRTHVSVFKSETPVLGDMISFSGLCETACMFSNTHPVILYPATLPSI